MPEGVGYSGSNVVVTPGLGLNYVNNFVFAYSGAVANAGGGSSTPDTMLEFETGAETIEAKLFFGVQFAGANDTYLLMHINDVQVMGITFIETGGGNNLTGNPIEFVLPPYSNVRISWGIDGVTKNGFAILSGKIYT